MLCRDCHLVPEGAMSPHTIATEPIARLLYSFCENCTLHTDCYDCTCRAKPTRAKYFGITRVMPCERFDGRFFAEECLNGAALPTALFPWDHFGRPDPLPCEWHSPDQIASRLRYCPTCRHLMLPPTTPPASAEWSCVADDPDGTGTGECVCLCWTYVDKYGRPRPTYKAATEKTPAPRRARKAR